MLCRELLPRGMLAGLGRGVGKGAGLWVGGICKSSAGGKASLVAVAAICCLGEVRGFRLTIEAQARKEMYEKEVSRLLDGPLRLLVGRDGVRRGAAAGRGPRAGGSTEGAQAGREKGARGQQARRKAGREEDAGG